jgi:hypothetical protein
MPNPSRETYSHGHHDSVLRSHRWRTAENSAAYLLPWLKPADRLLDVGVGPGTITVDFAERLTDVRLSALTLRQPRFQQPERWLLSRVLKISACPWETSITCSFLTRRSKWFTLIGTAAPQGPHCGPARDGSGVRSGWPGCCTRCRLRSHDLAPIEPSVDKVARAVSSGCSGERRRA